MRSIGDATLTYEVLSTLLAQIETILNSQPSEPLTDDPDECSAHLRISRLSRWKLIQKQKLQSFWSHWSRNYLQFKQSISKGHDPNHEMKTGLCFSVMRDFLHQSGFLLESGSSFRQRWTHPSRFYTDSFLHLSKTWDQTCSVSGFS